MTSTERMVSRASLSGAPLGNLRVTVLPCLGLSGNVYDRVRQMPMKCDEIWSCSQLSVLRTMGLTSVSNLGVGGSNPSERANKSGDFRGFGAPGTRPQNGLGTRWGRK